MEAAMEPRRAPAGSRITYVGADGRVRRLAATGTVIRAETLADDAVLASFGFPHIPARARRFRAPVTPAVEPSTTAGEEG
jgi:hypothetical protein